MSKMTRLSVHGMMCNGCVTAIEKALERQSGVIKAKVNFETRSVLVVTGAPLSASIEAIKSAGYDATELETVDKEIS